MADRGFLVTWGLFRALEAALDGDGLPDRTVDDLYEAALEEIGCGGCTRAGTLSPLSYGKASSTTLRNSAATAAAPNGSSVSNWGGPWTFPTPEKEAELLRRWNAACNALHALYFEVPDEGKLSRVERILNLQ